MILWTTFAIFVVHIWAYRVCIND